MYARTHLPVGREVHLGTDVYRLFDGCNFLCILIVALLDNGFDEGYRYLFRLCCRLYAEQLPQPYAVVATVGRQEVYRLAFCTCLVNAVLQHPHRQGFLNAHYGGFLLERRLDARPYDVVDGQFIAEDHLLVFIDVDDGGQGGIVEPEEI